MIEQKIYVHSVDDVAMFNCQQLDIYDMAEKIKIMLLFMGYQEESINRILITE